MNHLQRQTPKHQWIPLLHRLTLLVVVFGSVLAFTADAAACSVCYGDPDSPMVKGAEAGVLFLAVVVYGVLFGMGGIGVLWFIRARRLTAVDGGLEDSVDAAGVDQDGQDLA
jgi:hypothetical protein